MVIIFADKQRCFNNLYWEMLKRKKVKKKSYVMRIEEIYRKKTR